MTDAAEGWASPNHDARPEGGVVDILVIHYTGMIDAESALRRLCDPAFNVSAHYLIDEDGRVVRLVPEDRRAWHAGAAFWRGATNINARSIGVELVNPGHEYGYRAFPRAQTQAFEALARDIMDRHPIPARNVVGHSDVAPRRKTDPGELFCWPALAAKGVGLWPAAPEAVSADADGAKMLARFGYETEDLTATVAAFQRRFRPARIDGVADAETLGLLAGLLRLTG